MPNLGDDSTTVAKNWDDFKNNWHSISLTADILFWTSTFLGIAALLFGKIGYLANLLPETFLGFTLIPALVGFGTIIFPIAIGARLIHAEFAKTWQILGGQYESLSGWNKLAIWLPLLLGISALVFSKIPVLTELLPHALATPLFISGVILTPLAPIMTFLALAYYAYESIYGNDALEVIMPSSKIPPEEEIKADIKSQQQGLEAKIINANAGSDHPVQSQVITLESLTREQLKAYIEKDRSASIKDAKLLPPPKEEMLIQLLKEKLIEKIVIANTDQDPVTKYEDVNQTLSSLTENQLYSYIVSPIGLCAKTDAQLLPATQQGIFMRIFDTLTITYSEDNLSSLPGSPGQAEESSEPRSQY